MRLSSNCISVGIKNPYVYNLVVIVNARLEHIFGHAADRAAPVSRKILKCRAGSNAMLRVTFRRVISISTGIAKIFLHNISLQS